MSWPHESVESKLTKAQFIPQTCVETRHISKEIVWPTSLGFRVGFQRFCQILFGFIESGCGAEPRAPGSSGSNPCYGPFQRFQWFQMFQPFESSRSSRLPNALH